MLKGILKVIAALVMGHLVDPIGGLVCLVGLFADTSFATDDDLTVKHWSAYIFKEAKSKSYFQKFIGPKVSKKDTRTTSNAIIMEDTDLMKEAGDRMRFPLRMKLDGAGKKNDEALEGNEEELVFYNADTTLYLRENAVRAAGKMTMKRTKFSIKMQAKEALGIWLAEKMDYDIIRELSGLANADVGKSASAPSTNRKWYGGQTSTGTLEEVADDNSIDSATNNIFGTAVISAIKRKAMMADPEILPIKIDGDEYFVFFIHPYQMKALRADDDWWDAQSNANVRGMKNPIFSGAAGIFDGVIIHVCRDIETRYATQTFESGDAINTGMYVARSLFCGAQAVIRGWGQRPQMYEKNFEYNRIPGVATDAIYSTDKATFNDEDFACITVDTAYVPD